MYEARLTLVMYFLYRIYRTHNFFPLQLHLIGVNGTIIFSYNMLCEGVLRWLLWMKNKAAINQIKVKKVFSKLLIQLTSVWSLSLSSDVHITIFFHAFPLRLSLLLLLFLWYPYWWIQSCVTKMQFSFSLSIKRCM